MISPSFSNLYFLHFPQGLTYILFLYFFLCVIKAVMDFTMTSLHFIHLIHNGIQQWNGNERKIYKYNII